MRIRYLARWTQDKLFSPEHRRKSLRDRRSLHEYLLKALVVLISLGFLGAMVYAYILIGKEAVSYARMDLASPNAMHGLLPESDMAKISLNRQAPDYRSDLCQAENYKNRELSSVSVIIIFCNEPFETLVRSVHSVLNRSPPDILKEIVLVDDGSDAEHIAIGGNDDLIKHLAKLPIKVKLIRNRKRMGIVGARMTGIHQAQGEIFVILDSHIEVQPGWLEPLVLPISLNPETVVMPHIDGIDIVTKQPRKGGIGCTLGIIWKVMEHAFTPDPKYSTKDRLNRQNYILGQYVTSPTMAGGLFAANKDWFLSIGGYDSGMRGWGAENVEFSFRLWMCGGRLLCTECSRVNHMFGGGKFYSVQPGSVKTNRMRTIALWMDEFADLAWKVLGKPSFDEIGDLTEINKMKTELKCHDFKWFLRHVWPESEVQIIPGDVPYLGIIRATNTTFCISDVGFGTKRAKLTDCHYKNKPESLMYWKREGRVTVETNDELCLKNDLSSNWCTDLENTGWDVIEVILNRFSKHATQIATENNDVIVKLKQRRKETSEESITCLTRIGSTLEMTVCDPTNKEQNVSRLGSS